MSWDEHAATWDQGAAQRAYAERAFESLRTLAAEHGFELAGARVCDFGCGTGLLTERLAPLARAVDGVDTSPGMLAVLREKQARRGWRHVHAHASLPAPGDPYDLIVCSSVCAFLDDYPAAVARLAARLRRGGLFVQWDWQRAEGEDGAGLSRGEIRQALEHAGLAVLTVAVAFTVEVEGHAMRPLVGVGRRDG